METTFPWYPYQILQMMYNSYFLLSDQIITYPNNLLNFGRIENQQNQLPIFDLSSKNQPYTQEDHPRFFPITLKEPSERKIFQTCNELCNLRHKNKIHKKQNTDENDYLPIRKTSQILSVKTNSTSLNENRNILPNAIHQILSFVQRKNKSQKIVEKLITKYTLQECLNQQNTQFKDSDIPQLSVAKFYAYQNQLKGKMPNYVKLDTFKFLCTEQSVDWKSEVFSAKEQMIYNKICRAVIVYYLKEEVVCVIMSSKRMQRDKKRQHLKANRKIEAYIKSGFRQSQI